MIANETNSIAAFEALSRWNRLATPEAKAELLDRKARLTASDYRNNIESYIGTISIPLGLAVLDLVATGEPNGRV